MEWLLDKTPEESGETPGESDTVAESTEQPRDPKTGRFVPQETEETAEEEPEAPSEEDTVEEEASDESPEDGEEGELVLELDPDLEAILEKYDGDLNKALKALGDSQSMIGRQGNELGDLRQQISQLTEAVQQRVQQPLTPAFAPPYQNSLDEDPQGLVIEVLERSAAGLPFDERTYESAIAAWGEEDPFGAARLDAQVAFARQQAAAQAQQEQMAVPAEKELEQAMATVVQRHPDVEQYLPAIGDLAKEFPTLRDSMDKGTPSQKAQAFEELLKIAKSRSGDTSREAIKRVVIKTQEEVRKEKADAAVISAKNTTAASAQEPSDLDLFHREFRRATGQPLDE